MGGLDIAQAAFAFLDLRFKQIDRTAIGFVPRGALGKFLADKAVHAFLDQLGFDRLFEFAVKGKIAAQKARVEQGRANLHVALGQTYTLAHGAGRVAHLQPTIPQGIEQSFGHRFDDRRDLPGIQKKQVDIRLRVELAAPVSALRDNRETGILSGKTIERIGADGAQQVANQMIHYRRISDRHFHAAGALAMALVEQATTALDIILRQSLEIGLDSGFVQQ